MKRSVNYLTAVSAAGAMAVLVLWGNGFSQAKPMALRLKLLADAFTVPGVLLMMTAALIWAASHGFFDGIGYAGRVTARMLLPYLAKEYERFYDYKRRKADRRYGGYSFLFYVGAAFFAISLGFIAAFYTV